MSYPIMHDVFIENLLSGTVEIDWWRHGDAPPAFGSAVGIDTETELITDTVLHPDVVVLGCFDGDNMKCHLVDWHDIPEFMELLHDSGVEQRYFNIGFDEGVIDNVDERQCLMFSINEGRVLDMQVRAHLYELANIGYIRYNVHSLAGCSQEYLNLHLDKGEEDGENADRLTFSRSRDITESQARYLCMDCVSTWCLGNKLPAMPTEVIHTKGMVVLNHISANGFRVDMRVFTVIEDMLKADRDVARLRLIQQHFPDPYKRNISDAAEAADAFVEALKRLLGRYGLETTCVKPPKKDALRRIILTVHDADGKPDGIMQCVQDIKALCEAEKVKYGKALKTAYDTLAEDNALLEYDENPKGFVMQVFVTKMIEHLCTQLDDRDTYAKGISFQAAYANAENYADQHKEEWRDEEKPEGPRTFFQRHVSELTEKYPQLYLNVTGKSGDLQLTKNDQWKLQDAGVKDEFLEAYMEFNHCVKYLSTYLNRDLVKSDGRVHPRFTGIMRTGRTSCSNPNIQNLPSRDHKFALKNMYCADEGMILCATDFDFVELVCLAQSCYKRFGRSKLRDIINAGVDPHRWYAGVKAKLITNDTSFAADPEKVKEMNAFLKANVSKEARQFAKAANFGLPGGMGVNRFYQSCREQGLVLDKATAAELRASWLSAFSEMELHMYAQQMPVYARSQTARAFGFSGELEEQDDDGAPRDYFAVNALGMKRVRCTKNSALNFQFQSLAAAGAKLAMWNLAMAGFMPRLYNFVHDEVIYGLYPDELKEYIPAVEDCMIRGMRQVCPDVRVGVETSVMLHWDKGAQVYNDLKWSEDGRPLIDEPDFIKKNVFKEK